VRRLTLMFVFALLPGLALACEASLFRVCREPSDPLTLEGVPVVLDGDTIVLGTERVRLAGLDAEEVAHPGYPINDPNGPAARAALQEVVGVGAPVTCDVHGRDRHGRIVGMCFNDQGEDIAALMVKRGAALDCQRYSGGRYRGLEPEGARERLRQAGYC
jgi:micrococcal nuclease